MAFWKKKTEQRALTAENIPPVMLQSAPGNVTPGNATAIGDAYACIRVLVDAAASVPLIAYRRTENGRERVEGGRLPELLRQPAPAVTQSAFIGQVMTHLQTHGNCFVGKFKRDGVVEQLALLHPDRVQVEIKAGEPRYTYTSPGGQRQTLTTADVIHIRSAVSSDGVLGLSPVKQARTVLGLSDQLAKHAAGFFNQDSVLPRGVLRVEGASDENLSRIKEKWQNDLGGPNKGHGVAFVEGGIEFEAVSMPLDDLQFLQQRKLSATETARVFRVPAYLISAEAGNSMTYKNLETASIEFVTHSLRPWLVAIEQAISNDPDLCFNRVYTEFLLDALMRADGLSRAQVYKLALDPLSGWMTREEVRRLENLEPEPFEPDISANLANAIKATNGTGDGERISTQNGAMND